MREDIENIINEELEKAKKEEEAKKTNSENKE